MNFKGRLKGSILFNGLDKKVFENIWTLGKIVQLPKNHTCFNAREPVNNVYVLLEGKAIIYNLTHLGQRKILFILGEGELLNENIISESFQSTSCDTIEDSVLFAINKAMFINLMASSFELTKSVFRVQERRIWRLSHQLKNTIGGVNMERKLASKLWKLGRDFGIKAPEGIVIDITMTITFLSDFLGAPRETTSRACKLLSEYGLIKMENRRITIINPDLMSAFYKKGSIK